MINQMFNKPNKACGNDLAGRCLYKVETKQVDEIVWSATLKRHFKISKVTAFKAWDMLAGMTELSTHHSAT